LHNLDQHGIRTHSWIRYRHGKELDLSLHAGGIFGEAMMYMFAGDMTAENVATPWLLVKADFRLGESSKLKTQVYWNHYQGDLGFRAQLRGYGVWIADFPDLLWRSDTVDAQIHFEHLFFDNLMFIAGTNLRYSTLSGGGLILNDDDEVRGAGFVHLQWEPLEQLQLVGGVRLDLNDLTNPALSPRVTAVFRPWLNQAFRVGYGLAFRKPSFFEMLMHLDIQEYNPAFPEIVELMRTQVGNPDLDNMQLHSIEAGWQGRFLEDRLRASVDLYYNMYRKTMAFIARVPMRLGLPYLPESFIGFTNSDYDGDVMGAEIEVSWQPSGSWSFWGNLGFRKADYFSQEVKELRELDEPKMRLNAGVRYLPDRGLFADVAVHYVATYWQYMPHPENMLDENEVPALGDHTLMIARLGYRFEAGDDRAFELGLTVRTPLGSPFREFDGMPWPATLPAGETSADFGGEILNRLLAGYLRAWF